MRNDYPFETASVLKMPLDMEKFLLYNSIVKWHSIIIRSLRVFGDKFHD